jgi:ribosomal protein S21
MKVNASIAVEQGESIESIIRRFKKAVDKGNVIRNYARKSEFISESARRIEKSRRARKRIRDSGKA